MKIKPKLVDYSLFHKPKPKPKIIKPVPKKIIVHSSSNNMSFLVNIIGLLVLIIGGLCLYERLKDRNKDELEKQNVILGFHQYVKDKIE